MTTSCDIALCMEDVRQRAIQLARLAREEDLGRAGDITSALGPETEQATFHLLGKQVGVFAGREIAADVVEVFGPRVRIKWMDAGQDGRRIERPPVHLATLSGPEHTILSAERTLLNFLQRLSGVATATRRYVDAVAGTAAGIFDTRKTLPGWRLLDKYAVRCGGGFNHRLGLHDAVLLKDNHLAHVPPERLAHAVARMYCAAAERRPAPAFFEVEADRLEQVEQLLAVDGIDVILLDNFSIEAMQTAVAMRNDMGLGGRVQLEVSGGVTLDAVAAIAQTGVERISVGAITHSASALDLSLERVTE
jgi:nicotinate-nucleotide pyrophosphorylase (carboxylating)